MKKMTLKSFVLTIIIICSSLIISTINAQDTLWTRRFDQGRNEEAWCMTKDPFDNIITVGPLRDSFTSDILLLKYNQNGDLLWSRQFDTGQLDWGFCVTSDSAGNIIVGSYHDDLTIEKPGLTKFSSNGETIWSKMYPELAYFWIEGVTLDADGNIYSCGSGTTSAVIMKCDPSGNILWRRFYNWQNEPCFTEIVIDETGNLFVTGFLGIQVLFVGKFNNNGDSLWTRRYPASGYSAGSGLKLDQQRNIIVVGSLLMGNNDDAVIVKYSPTGSMLWNRVFNYHPCDVFYDLCLDSHNNIYCGGSSGLWLGWTNFLLDYLIVKLSPTGETLWTRFYNGLYDDAVGGVVTDNQNNPIITGRSYNGANYDILTIKYCGTSGIVENKNEKVGQKIGLKISPRIAKQSFLINYTITRHSSITLDVVDGLGRIRNILTNEQLKPGNYKLNYNTSDLPAGVYFVRLKQGSEQIVERAVIVK